MCTELPLGSKIENGKIVIDEDKIEADRHIKADIRTANIVLEIANGVSEFIDLTVDSPSMNESGWMPLLDLQVCVRENKVLYKLNNR